MSLSCLSAEFTTIEEQLPLDQWSPGMDDNSSWLTVGVLPAGPWVHHSSPIKTGA
jgi:hypothetical protein